MKNLEIGNFSSGKRKDIFFTVLKSKKQITAECNIVGVFL